jgi:twitching motility protein PilJ
LTSDPELIECARNSLTDIENDIAAGGGQTAIQSARSEFNTSSEASFTDSGFDATFLQSSSDTVMQPELDVNSSTTHTANESFSLNPFELEENVDDVSLAVQEHHENQPADEEDGDLTALIQSDHSAELDTAYYSSFEGGNDRQTFLDDSFASEEDDLPNTGIIGFVGSDSFASETEDASLYTVPSLYTASNSDSAWSDDNGDSPPTLAEFEFDDQSGVLEPSYSMDMMTTPSLLDEAAASSGLLLDDFEAVDSALNLNQDNLDAPNSMGTPFPNSFPVPVTPKSASGVLAPFTNASLQQKQLITAATAGVLSAGAVVGVGVMTPQANLASFGMGALAAGVVGGASTLALGQITAKQIKASTSDLQAKLSAVAQGDWSVRATEFSKDEFGQLATSFNEMTRFIEATTQEVQNKAEEQEKAKEDLQRQVIRLLDDVEGAARGDLTVQAEVTADILGAVADSFNLTIYNLQKIVKQVKVAAREVNRGAADNEEFARGLSSDALRQAEELAVSLNSVQMMTASIQEVAESARAADQVAQKASDAALKGGEAVENTMAGILQIRETVAESTRKVKRLAESSQEISKIVGLISQIASRTNLLALNASIEAARAGESGRGFAIVADEVRQLADRASKSSKEIEQIVLQIQGETSSVMAAMEEGTQQVIEGTQRAEQAKRSLEDIIQVSSQINQLVSSITQATSEQTETSRYVSQVMQSVELTAQETSQEAQRVSDSLQNLVGVASDLQSSVERFRVDGTEVS